MGWISKQSGWIIVELAVNRFSLLAGPSKKKDRACTPPPPSIPSAHFCSISEVIIQSNNSTAHVKEEVSTVIQSKEAIRNRGKKIQRTERKCECQEENLCSL